MFSSTLLFATLLPALTVAFPTPSRTSSLPAASPRCSPAHIPPPSPNYLPLSHFSDLFALGSPPTGEASNLTARDVGEIMLRGVPHDVVGGSMSERDFVPALIELERREANWARKDALAAQRAIAATCVPSSSNDTYISSLFYYGGAGTTVYLCKDATIKLTNSIFFTAADQTLTTVGSPTGSHRATLVVTGVDQSCAIYGAVNGGDNIAVRNIQVDGSRPALGLIGGGIGLIEMGGNNVGHTVDNVHAFEPRGWSVLHLIEGYNNQCSGAQITNNQIGPSGHAPSGALQFRRDSTGNYAPGQWADGISLACQASFVSGNTVTDATDGGIVIFGAPGSKITGNTIISQDRQLLGGINMVDWSPFSGSFTGTEVTDNTIVSQSSFIKIGIALGGMTWGVDNRTVARTFGGLVQDNTFRSGKTGYFGYAIGMAGHNGATIQGNDARKANFGSIESPACFTNQFPLPTPQSFVADQWTTPGSSLQSGFTLSTLVLLVCRGPGKILARGGIS